MSSADLSVVNGLPRKLSALKDLPGFNPDWAKLSDKIAVFLNGVELEEVSAWDMDAGHIVRRRRNRDGSFVLDETGVPCLETLRGKVEVRWTSTTGSAA